jgi:hypothetical protein
MTERPLEPDNLLQLRIGEKSCQRANMTVFEATIMDNAKRRKCGYISIKNIG